MKHTILFIASVTAAIVSTACSTTVICEGENCQGTGAQGGSGAGSQGGSSQGGSSQGGSSQGGSSQGGSSQGGSTSVGGGSAGLAQFCDDMCACQGCSSFELQSCYDEVNMVVGEALEAGCQTELQWLSQCFDNTLQCINGELQFGCEKELNLLFECMEDTPPPSNICEAAFQICGEPGETPPCNGEMLCVSQCIVNAGHCNIEHPSLEACVNGCFN